MNKPTLFYFLGIPGSGKTHFVIQLAKKTKTIHLSSDHLRKSMWGNPDKFNREVGNPMVFGAMYYVVHEILKAGQSVLFDSNHNTVATRKSTSELATELNANAILVWVKVPLEVAIERATSRTETNYMRPTTTEKVKWHNEKLEEPGSVEPMILIDGQESFEVQYKSFKTQLAKFEL